MKYRIIRADETTEDINYSISKIFVEGFYQWLRFFSKDREKLCRAFTHMFCRDVFYVTMDGNVVAGIAGLNDGTRPTVILQKKELQKHLGWLMGTICYHALKNEFMDKKYPFLFNEREASVEFVATAPAYRGKGIASAIIGYFLVQPQYDSFVLEVADTNENAVRLYEKLGFKEFLRVEEKNKKQSGVNFLIYMRCAKEGA